MTKGALGRHLLKRGVLPRRKKKRRKERDQEAKAKSKTALVFGEISDSWDTRYRPEAEAALTETRRPLLPETLREEPETSTDDGYEIEVAPPRKRIKRDKRRNVSMTVSVSAEEEALIRKHLRNKETSFSGWARGLMFRAMGRKVPARPHRE